MNNNSKILCIDDDEDILKLINNFLRNENYNIVTTDSSGKALNIIQSNKPDLILLDVMMPDINGYDLCKILQKENNTNDIPIIFVTGLQEEKDIKKAFSLGAVDYIAKPIKKEILIEKVRKYFNISKNWKTNETSISNEKDGFDSLKFKEFKDYLIDQLGLSSDKKFKLLQTRNKQLYSITSYLGIDNQTMAKYISIYLDIQYIDRINSENIQLGILPLNFCKSNHILAVSDISGIRYFILSNPFDWELIYTLKRFSGLDNISELKITYPEMTDSICIYEPSPTKTESSSNYKQEKQSIQVEKTGIDNFTIDTDSNISLSPVSTIANSLLIEAVTSRASDIHIEPKEDKTIIRFRIDGDMKEVLTIKRKTASRLISKFKVIGKMDISERRKPQDGSFKAYIEKKEFQLRLATTSTQYGESMIIRLLEPSVNPPSLYELGFSKDQSDILIRSANKTEGIILIVGRTGSGKSTTIYSLLHAIDCKTRSLISVEDPIEYRISFANQQQVNIKAGVTFASLLKSSMRQDPDVLFMGEIRDKESANIAFDFASTGHLTITTLHTTNSTSAIFRLERLFIDRGTMADVLLCIVAQRLIKKLCPYCKIIKPISQKEIDILSPYSENIPEQVAHAAGCSKCNNTGFHGRDGVYEIIEFTPEISEKVRSGVPVSEIRDYLRRNKVGLLTDLAILKVKELIISPKYIYEKILVEEDRFDKGITARKSKKADSKTIIQKKTDYIVVKKDQKRISEKSILVVEDDDDSRTLVTRYLQKENYEVIVAKDGIEALLNFGKRDFDLIISDIDMPNMDGIKLIEMMNQKGINTPLLFLTSRSNTEDEIKALRLGAIDYIKKPFKKDILLLRVKKALII